MKTNLLILSVSLLLITSIAAGQPTKTMPMVEYPLLIGDEKLPDGPYYPYNPFALDDSIHLGTTYYDMQSMGACGDRIAVCDDGGIYCCWTNLSGWPYPPAQRGAWYAYIDPDGNYLYGGPIDDSQSSGFPVLDIIYGDQAAIVYHRSGANPPHIVVAVTNGSYYYPPFGSNDSYWPNITIDRDDNIHVVAHSMEGPRLVEILYTRSEDGGNNWIAPQLADSCMLISTVMASSPVSDRVVIAHAKSQDTTTQWHNDIVYIGSDDGTTWDWRYGWINVTNYGTDNDSLWAFSDLDVIIDHNDYVHLIWTAQWVTDEGIYYRTYLFHYNEETEEITSISHHPESLWYDISGAWDRPICRTNLGVEEATNYLFATWTQFDTSDVSAGGYGNGDIYMAFLEIGDDWEVRENITDSQTPRCLPGDCKSEHWASLADYIDDSFIYLLYIEDKDAGSIPMEEGVATENPVVYLEHTTAVVDIDDEVSLPMNFHLNQNYPNPFNASTNISFSLQDNGPVKLEIFDITGALVATLIDEYMPIGDHDINWDAEDYASGIYIYKLTSGGNVSARKAVLLK